MGQEEMTAKSAASLRAIVRRILLQKVQKPHAKGSVGRPIGKARMFLEDVKARGFEPRGILDVGANKGDWTRMALSVFPAASVVMIEPQDEMIPFLKALCEANSDIHFIHAGAAVENGEKVQTIWEDLCGSSFLPPVDDEALKTGRQRRTKVVSIDSILPQFPEFCPDLVKLDVQGFELEALRGAKSLFSEAELFVVETSLFRFDVQGPLTREVISFMAERHYELYDIVEFLRRPYDGALGQVDLAFAKSQGSLRASEQWFT